MSPRVRITAEILSPPLVAVFVYSLVVFTFTRDAVAIQAFPLMLLFAYIFAGIPSIVFAIVMEIAFRRGLKVRSWRTVLLASGLGLVSGIVVALCWARGLDNRHSAFSLFPALGCFTGFAVGFIVRTLAPREPNQPLQPTRFARG
jgi:hypothetical protein